MARSLLLSGEPSPGYLLLSGDTHGGSHLLLEALLMGVDIWLVQKAVYAALLAANVADGRVYDDVPVGAAMPYVEIGEGLDVEDDGTGSSGGGSGLEHVLTLHAWSRHHRGDKEIKQLVGAIRTALHREALTVAGLESCLAWIDGANYLTDRDGVTRHGVVRVRLSCRV